MLKLYDWQCCRCGRICECTIDVPANHRAPLTRRKSCWVCQRRTTHRRQMSLPAPYTGEKTYCPRVYGGKFDTMGYERGPKLPELKNGADLRDYARENKEVLRERREVFKANAVKRQRAKALKRGGQVNFRRDKAPRDPVI